MSEILQNALKIFDADKNKTFYPVSSHRHHYNIYEFEDGSYVAVDGGREYFRRGNSIKDTFNPNNKIEDYSLTEKSKLGEVKEKLLWGHLGKDGKGPIQYLPFKDLTVEHLKAILAYDDKLHTKLSDIQKIVINYWIHEKSE